MCIKYLTLLCITLVSMIAVCETQVGMIPELQEVVSSVNACPCSRSCQCPETCRCRVTGCRGCCSEQTKSNDNVCVAEYCDCAADRCGCGCSDNKNSDCCS